MGYPLKTIDEIRYDALAQDWNRLRNVERDWTNLRNIVIKLIIIVSIMWIIFYE
jgi:hypothetical protein